MQTIRRSQDRGHANHGWLDTYHSFSFADYHDPDHVQFGPLRVINEDRVTPGAGFGTHGHRDMEIISYVLEGTLSHRDSMGNGSTLRPGDVQRMSAGTGVRHSEFNGSASDKCGRLRLIASPEGEAGSVRLNQDACVHAGLFDGEERAELRSAPDRCLYVHLARGSLRVNGEALGAGDALMLSEGGALALDGGQDAEVLVFDLPLKARRRR